MKNKPNVLFIFTDDQRYDTIRAMGNKDILTPNLDKLASRGTMFRQAHIPSGTCGAVCMPSRAMLATGRHLFHLNDLGQDIPPSHTTMGETFIKAGYDTIGIGKWHNGPPAFTRSFSEGGSIFFGGMWDHWNVPTCEYDPSGKYDNTINFVVDFFKSNEVMTQRCDKFNPGKHSSELLTDTAISMMHKAIEKDNPLFLYLAYLAPHDPRTMPEKYNKLYPVENIELPPNFQETISMKYPLMVFRDESLASYPRQADEIKRNIAEYYAMITHLDAEVGRLLDELERSGEMDNTIVVFTSDNGLAVGQHGFLGKEDIYEHGVRVPLIFAGPNVPCDKVCDEYVYLYDIFPTLCDMINLDIPHSVDGKSFAHLFNDLNLKHRQELYFAFHSLIRGAKDKRYKLIEYAIGGESDDCATFLYDLFNDPYETINLYGKAEYNDIYNKLRDIIFKYRDEWEEMKHPVGAEFWNYYK